MVPVVVSVSRPPRSKSCARPQQSRAPRRHETWIPRIPATTIRRYPGHAPRRHRPRESRSRAHLLFGRPPRSQLTGLRASATKAPEPFLCALVPKPSRSRSELPPIMPKRAPPGTPPALPGRCAPLDHLLVGTAAFRSSPDETVVWGCGMNARAADGKGVAPTVARQRRANCVGACSPRCGPAAMRRSGPTLAIVR